MPNASTSLGVGLTRPRSACATAAASPPGHRAATACALGVGDGLDGGEGLRAHDEERGRRIEAGDSGARGRSRRCSTRSGTRSRVPERSERLIGHDRAEVGSADADVDYGRMRSPVCPSQSPIAPPRRMRRRVRARRAHRGRRCGRRPRSSRRRGPQARCGARLGLRCC